MNLMDDRTKEQKLVDTLITHHDRIAELEMKLSEAKVEQYEAWKRIYSDPRSDLYRPDFDMPEIIMVRDGAYVYMIHFDLVDFDLPKIDRSEYHYGVMDTKDWR